MPTPKTFGSVLRNLLFTSELYTLSTWAGVLKATPQEILQWTRDESYPTPAQLSKLLETVRGVRPNKLQEWDEVCHLPLRDFVLLVHLLPVSYRGMPNLAMYALWDKYEALLYRVAKLPVGEQLNILEYVSNELLTEAERCA